VPPSWRGDWRQRRITGGRHRAGNRPRASLLLDGLLQLKAARQQLLIDQGHRIEQGAGAEHAAGVVALHIRHRPADRIKAGHRGR